MENGSNLASHNQRPSPIDIETGNLVERDFPPLNNPFANPIFENETVECVNNGMTGRWFSITLQFSRMRNHKLTVFA